MRLYCNIMHTLRVYSINAISMNNVKPLIFGKWQVKIKYRNISEIGLILTNIPSEFSQ